VNNLHQYLLSGSSKNYKISAVNTTKVVFRTGTEHKISSRQTFILHVYKCFGCLQYTLKKKVIDLIIPGPGDFGFSDIPAGDGKIDNLFLR
jgi:hypothetical protein